ncbi:hypothetical protein AB833_00350 [Chromatiales bacterium (ex Bugula neritina AB1)]|nr:hypothetical protein AB833_00350 [Chromatiales bacterium (ex Bugula neritina AB1)]
MRRGRQVDRLTLAFLVTSALAMVVSMVVMLSAADKLAKDRGQQTAITEYSLILTRLENLMQGASSTVAATASSDRLGALVAGGDVYTGELAEYRTGLIGSSSGTLQKSADVVAQQWSALRRRLVDLNTSEVITDRPVDTFSNTMVNDAAVAFDDLFDAITAETFSTDLLRNVSNLRSSMKNIDYLINRDSSLSRDSAIATTINEFQGLVLELKSLVQDESGAVLLGYNTRQLLDTFRRHAAALTAESLLSPSVTGASTRGNKNTQMQVPDELAVALSGARKFRQDMAVAINFNRRLILVALSCVCAALLLAAISVWRIRRRQLLRNARQENSLGSVVRQLSDISAGYLDQSEGAAPIGSAASTALEENRQVITGLVYSSRDVAARTASLMSSQKIVLEEMQQINNLREQAVQSLSQQLSGCTADTTRLYDASVVAMSGYTSLQQEINQCADLTRRGATVLAEGAAQFDLAESRLANVGNAVRELSSVCSGLKQLAGRSNLAVLNKSLSTAALTDDFAPDDGEDFIEEMQQLVQRLSASADKAGRIAQQLCTDVDATRETLAHSESKISDGASCSNEATQALEGITNHAASAGNDIEQMLQAAADPGAVATSIEESLQLLDQLDRDLWERAEGLQRITSDLASVGATLDASCNHFQLQGARNHD